ncbi:MAG: polysaccharide pyruvyl transferase family protein [bacterium]|nr:polysaccharide pyruvyl transferase family protein [bacterium]
MKIIVSHAYSKENKGDAALLGVLVRDLRKAFDNPSITILTLDQIEEGERFEGVPATHSFMYYARSYYRSSLLQVLYAFFVAGYSLLWAIVYKAVHRNIPLPQNLKKICFLYRDTDLIVPVGGGYILGKPGFIHTARLFFVLHPFLLSYFLGKPTINYTQSIGVFGNRFQEIMAKFVLKRLDGIIVREGISYQLLKDWNITNNVFLSVDGGFLVEGVKKTDLRKELYISQEQIVVGITVRSWFESNQQIQYEKTIAEFSDYIIKKYNAFVIFIPQVTNYHHKDDDRESGQRVYEYLEHKESARVLKGQYDYQVIKALYGELDYMIGTRFHSVIFSLTSCIPAIAIEYDHKTRGIMTDLGLEGWVLDIRTITIEQLIGSFERLVAGRAEYVVHLQKILPTYIERARETIYLVKDLYEKKVMKNKLPNNPNQGKIRISLLIASFAIIASFSLSSWFGVHNLSGSIDNKKPIETGVVVTSGSVSTTTSTAYSNEVTVFEMTPPSVVNETISLLSPRSEAIGHSMGIAAGGLLAKISISELNQRLDQMVALGVEWVRFDIEWGNVQYDSPDRSNWKYYDTLVKTIAAHHLKSLGIIVFTPEWARTANCTGGAKCPPRDPALFATFAAQVVARYKNEGVHHWEIWNEPNNYNFWATKSDCVAYAALLKETYPAIKRVDPKAVIITGGLSPASTNDVNFSPVDFLECIYKNGAKNYFDAVGHHPYSYPNQPSNVTAGAWAQMYKTSPSLRSTMVANGDQDKKIWITEFGTPTNGPDAHWFVSEENQSRMVSEAVALYKTFPWGGPFFWYTLKDDGVSTSTNENFFGLIRYDGSPKPAYNVLREIILKKLY